MELPSVMAQSNRSRQYLSKLATGEMLGCFCLTEPQAGSDASALMCQAVRDGDEWVINGTKQFITTGKYADVAFGVCSDG